MLNKYPIVPPLNKKGANFILRRRHAYGIKPVTEYHYFSSTFNCTDVLILRYDGGQPDDVNTIRD